MSITVAVVDTGALGLLVELQRQLRDLTPVMKAIGRKLESNVNVRFDTKTAPDGSAWAPWSETTAAARAEEGRGTLLEYTGRMRDSLAYEATATSVEVGFGVPYAVYHEVGTSRMPARPVLFDGDSLGSADLDDVVAVALRQFKKQLKLGNVR